MAKATYEDKLRNDCAMGRFSLVNKAIYSLFSLLCLCSLLSGCTLFRGGAELDKLHKESKAFAETMVPYLTSECSPKKMGSIASPELLTIAPLEKMDKFCKFLSGKLGKFKSNDTVLGEISFLTPPNRPVMPIYKINSTFEKGKATITLILIQHDKQWQVMDVDINSDLLRECEWNLLQISCY